MGGIKSKLISRRSVVLTVVYQETQKNTITDTSDPIKMGTVEEGLP